VGEDEGALEETVEVKDDEEDDKRAVVSEEAAKVAKGIEAEDAHMRRALVNPMSHLSLCIFVVLKMQSFFSLFCDPMVELLCICLLSNLALVFHRVCSLWMGKLQQPFWSAFGTKQRVVPLHHMRCCENGFRSNWGGNPTFTFANSIWPGIFKKSFSSRIKSWDEANERCKASLRNLREILQEAKTESAECAMERLTQSVKNGGVDGIGKITRISFCLLAVCVGLLGSDHAKEQALRGFASELSTSGKKLIELGCKKEHLGSLCRGLAHSHNEPEHCVENGACKAGRKCTTVFGFFAKFQDLFDVKFDGALGRILLCIKRFGNKNWEEFEPPVLQKEE
jgi:hypothetical protein